MKVNNELGRKLKVSELKPRTVVWVHKGGQLVSLWVVEIGEEYVAFAAGVTRHVFCAMRCGPDLEEITDDAQSRINIFEYLGEP